MLSIGPLQTPSESSLFIRSKSKWSYFSLHSLFWRKGTSCSLLKLLYLKRLFSSIPNTRTPTCFISHTTFAVTQSLRGLPWIAIIHKAKCLSLNYPLPWTVILLTGLNFSVNRERFSWWAISCSGFNSDQGLPSAVLFHSNRRHLLKHFNWKEFKSKNWNWKMVTYLSLQYLHVHIKHFTFVGCDFLFIGCV